VYLVPTENCPGGDVRLRIELLKERSASGSGSPLLPYTEILQLPGRMHRKRNSCPSPLKAMIRVINHDFRAIWATGGESGHSLGSPPP
jgi:hypothetical protein